MKFFSKIKLFPNKMIFFIDSSLTNCKEMFQKVNISSVNTFFDKFVLIRQ
jgi:hypothetical protein